jgi:hypothetical protein
MTESIFREIDEDIRREKLEQLWKKHGRLFVIAIVVVVVAVGAGTLWQERQTSAMEKATAALASTLQQLKADNHTDITTQLETFSASAPEGPATLARLYAAGVAANGENNTAALAQLRTLADDKQAPELYRSLAQLLLTQARMDSEDPVTLQNELSPLKEDGKPWRYSARELSALLSLKQGDIDSARATLEALQQDNAAPGGIRERATRLLATLSTP